MFNQKRKFQEGRFEKKDEFDSKLLDLARVVRVAAGGRRHRLQPVDLAQNALLVLIGGRLPRFQAGLGGLIQRLLAF